MSGGGSLVEGGLLEEGVLLEEGGLLEEENSGLRRRGGGQGGERSVSSSVRRSKESLYVLILEIINSVEMVLVGWRSGACCRA